MSKLCRKMKSDDAESSEDEVSTPEKILRAKPVNTVGSDTLESAVEAKQKEPVLWSGNDDAKVKRRLDDDFSSSVGKRPVKSVIVKKEKN